nr:MASE1 domain-containing protein [Actinopolymorpha cephalotaxi]
MHNRSRFGVLVRILGVAAACYASSWLGVHSPLGGGVASPLWPPTGVGLVALLVLGPRVWPGITIGAMAMAISPEAALPAVAAITIGATLTSVLGYLLLDAAGFRPELPRLRDVLVLVVLGGIAPTVVGATVVVCSLQASGALTADFGTIWLIEWIGDALGVLVVAPFLLMVLRLRWPQVFRPARWLEATVLFAAMVTLLVLTLRADEQLLFLTFPFVVWAAWRFQLAAATACALVATTLAFYAASRGMGAFAFHSDLSNILTLQSFAAVAALTALVLSVTVAARNEARAHVEEVAVQLAAAVHQLDRRLRVQPGADRPASPERGNPDPAQPKTT